MKFSISQVNTLILYLSMLTIITACGTVKRGSYIPDRSVDGTPAPSDSTNIKPMMSISSSSQMVIHERQDILRLAYDDWKGIPYVLGGSGYNGIDCSAFMQVVFEDYFSINLPRTTLEQLEVGRPVNRSGITPGDMVFFKTGRRTYHVGIMMNSTEFLHASTSEGVTVSELSHPYWESSFIGFRRVLKDIANDS